MRMLRELLAGPELSEEGKDPGIPEGPIPEKETEMKLKNVLIVVSDIERSRKYYHDLFGLEMILDNDGNEELSRKRHHPPE